MMRLASLVINNNQTNLHSRMESKNDPQNQAFDKLPQLTIFFWITKIIATTFGETGGDFLAQTLKLGYALSTLIFLGFFLITVSIQLFSSRYNPILYWSVIVATSTAGTTMSDYMDRTLGLGYAAGSLIIVTMLLIVLSIWKATEKSIAVSNIRSKRGETFYWVSILFSNTLGTALGDFLADDSGLGFGGAALLITCLLILIILAYYFTKTSHIILFWLAFILTRPFGATFGDLLTKPKEIGGLGLGTAGSSLILLIMLALFIFYERRSIKRLVRK